jgi:uncharacterized protein DUF4230
VASETYEPGRAGVPEERTVRQRAGSDLHPTSELPEVDTGTGWPDEPTERRQPEEPRGRSRAAGCLFWLAGLIALLLVLGIGLKVTGLLPHLSNPFASKKTDRSQPTLLLSIQDLSRFEAASGNFQEVIDVQKDRSYIPDIIFNERTLFVCVGSVDAYVDFSNIGKGDIVDSPDHKTVTISLPAPGLEKPNIDHDKSYIFATQEGLINKIGDIFSSNPNKENELYQLGEQRIAQAARDSGLADRAAANTREMLTQMLRSLGYTTITIKFAAT